MIHKSKENGFSYVDVMIALVILMVGILASAQALTANLVRSYETEKQIVAKQTALSTIESIFSARDIARAGAVSGWNTIGNVGSVDTPQGIFLSEFCPIRRDLGWDGVAGTADDACPGTGACQVAGRPDNTSEIIQGFQRKIVITDLEDPERPSPPHSISRRRIDVTIRYFVNRLQREQTISTIITNYAE